MTATQNRKLDGEKVMPLDAEDDEFDAPRPRRWPWLLGATIVVAGVVWLIGQGGDTTTTAAPVTPSGVAEAVRTDLIEITELDGTLGRAEGDPITAGSAGTIAAAASAGTTVVQGDVLYEIDGEPVVLLYGYVPAYRDLSISAETDSVAARSSGTVTWVAEPGTAIAQGDVLYEVNGMPVVALYGSVPAYRTMRDLSENMTGDDVAQLETALTALGFNESGSFTADDEFTFYTEQAVIDWQESIGAEDDGAVDLGEVVFIPGPTEVATVGVAAGDTVNDGKLVLTIVGSDPMEGEDVLQLEEALVAIGYDTVTADGIFDATTKAAVLAWQAATGTAADGVVNQNEVVFASGELRITGQSAPPGSSVNPGATVLTTTSSEIAITAALPAEDQQILSAGDKVTIQLPDFSTTPGTVQSVASVATRVEGAGAQATFEVTILLDDPSVAGDLDEAPVEVQITTDSVSDVVAVPVTALLALREGGYAVELVLDDGSTQLVGVEPGFFADGLVEVDGLQPGDRVVIP